MKISFHGADRDVTGSCHLVECGGRRILVDCGMYQGGRALEEENAEPFGFDPSRVDVVLLTHAHLDHCGRLPLLVARGFQGEVVTTSATRELSRLVMLDSAHVMEEDARRRARRKARKGKEGEEDGPLYTEVEALNAMDRFGRTARYGEPVSVVPGVRATFVDAGHILGSACILVELEEGEERRSILFSGDLGNPGRPLLRPPATPPKVDVVIMETTYGDRDHRDPAASAAELWEAVSAALVRGGNVVIPTFALERSQEILFDLRRGLDADKLPSLMQVYLDSPMAISATEIYRRHPECYGPDAAALMAGGKDPFGMPSLRFTRETAESKALNEIRSGAVILAGSGMCTGGRVRHHLKHNIWRSQSAVVFVGYAARGTLARRIIDGANPIRIFGEELPVRASIHTINGYSAHADRSELLAWHRSTGAGRTVLVHGEEEAMKAFGDALSDTEVLMPARGDVLEL